MVAEEHSRLRLTQRNVKHLIFTTQKSVSTDYRNTARLSAPEIIIKFKQKLRFEQKLCTEYSHDYAQQFRTAA